MSELILQVKGLSKYYSEFELTNVNLELPRGYIMGFIGQNGAGKTTTIKSILNLIHRDFGEVRLFGKDMQEAEQEIKDRIGFVGENQYFYEEMSVAWTVGFFKKIYSQWNDKLCSDLLKKYKISPSKKVKALSKGQRVKLALVMALAHDPELLILDEPTSGLDPAARHDVLQDVLELIADGNKSVFFSSHITQDLEKVADYVTFIDNGQILFSEEKDVVLDQYRKVIFTVSHEQELQQLRSSFVSFKNAGNSCVGITDSVDLIRSRVNDLEVQRVGLEDIFLAHVKGEIA